MNVLFKRTDGSFVIERNNLPYHVTAQSPLFAEAQAAGASAPFEPPLPEPTLAEKRAQAILSRSQFIQAVFAAGILSRTEAIAAAAGTVPNFFETALAALVSNGDLTQAEADQSEILWAGLTQVERNHPLLPIAQSALGLTDAQVDALFGIT